MALPLRQAATRHEAFAALKRRLTDCGLAAPRIAVEAAEPTGLPAVDRLLGGGFPRGTLVALEGSAGRWSLAARVAAMVTRRAMAAIIDDGGLYPPGLADAGVRLDRVLIVPAATALQAARAADVLLRSRACRLVLMSAPELRPAVWSRLAGLAHRTGMLLLAIADRAAPALTVAAGMRVRCSREQLVVEGTRGIWCTFDGYGVRAELHKAKSSVPGGAVSVAALH